MTLYTTGFMFCSGTIIQTFMISVGMNDTTVSIYNAVIQFVQAAMIFAMIFVADRIRKVVKTFAVLVLTISLISISLIICIFFRSDSDIVKLIIFASSIITYLIIGIKAAIDSKIFYSIIDMRELGRINGMAVAISGLISFGVSALYSFAVSKFDYYDVMLGFFIFSVIAIVLSSAICFSYKVNNEKEDEDKPLSKKPDLSVFKDRTSRVLALPSLFRGFAAGIIGLITIVGFSGGILDIETATYVTLITQITSFAGNMLFSIFSKKVKSSMFLLISSIVVGVVLPISIINGQLLLFLIGYAIVNLAYVIVNIAVPTLICEIVPYEHIGSFTCVRMMVFTLGSVIASLVYKPLSDLIGFLGLFIVAAVMQVLCGVIHYIVAKKSKNLLDESSETKQE